MKKIFLILFLVLFFAGANGASAATLYLDPESKEFGARDTFTVEIRLDNDGECVNAAQVVLDYPQDTLRAIDVSTGNSIFTLFPEEPAINEAEGLVEFAGGLPGGYCGRVPGDPGLTNMLATVIFQPLSGTPDDTDDGKHTVTLAFGDDSKVYLHDGLGTEASLTTFGAEIEIDENSVEGTGEWFKFLEEDITPPEPFTIEVVKNPQIFGGNYYIIFTTTDKGSGIDHYEVLEKSLDDDFLARLFWFNRAKEFWEAVTSPYVLEDQGLNSVITVKAVDKAGNERIASYVPPEYLRQSDNTDKYVVVAFAIIALMAVGFVIKQKPQLFKFKGKSQ